MTLNACFSSNFYVINWQDKTRLTFGAPDNYCVLSLFFTISTVAWCSLCILQFSYWVQEY